MAGALVATLVAGGVWWFASGGAQTPWDRVQVGMTEAEVETILGKPESVVNWRRTTEIPPPRTWFYESPIINRIRLSSRFPFISDTDMTRWSYCVYMSSDGRVTGKHKMLLNITRAE